MPSEVRQQIDDGQPYPVIRFTGVLDATTAPEVGSGLLGVLAGQPEAVVVDVRELTVGARDAVAILRAVARDAAGWPGCHLAVVTGPAADPQAGAWRDTGLPLWPTPEEAVAALGTPDPESFLSAALKPVVGTARQARELVTEACLRWELPDLAGPACIVVTELVNNVVVHAHTPMTVMLARHGESMSVAVRDGSTHVPRFTGEPVPVTSYGGRGLLLIDSVAQRWGSLVLADGKVVWALLEPEAQAGNQLPSTGLAGRAAG
jgi:hypothetical protein